MLTSDIQVLITSLEKGICYNFFPVSSPITIFTMSIAQGLMNLSTRLWDSFYFAIRCAAGYDAWNSRLFTVLWYFTSEEFLFIEIGPFPFSVIQDPGFIVFPSMLVYKNLLKVSMISNWIWKTLCCKESLDSFYPHLPQCQWSQSLNMFRPTTASISAEGSGVNKGGTPPLGAAFRGLQIEVGMLRSNRKLSNTSGCYMPGWEIPLRSSMFAKRAVTNFSYASRRSFRLRNQRLRVVWFTVVSQCFHLTCRLRWVTTGRESSIQSTCHMLRSWF